MAQFLEKYRKILVSLLLFLMGTLGLLSMISDSGIVDEVAHIPAGYSYLKFGDFRLNPEHPPLLKDLAALPLLFLDLKFPSTIPAWTTQPNGQWEVGWHFIYHIGNNADQILFLSRLPILLLALFFGYVLYHFARKRYGTSVALLTLFFYTLSPNFLAHSRFVTTDVGIAAFIFFALYSFFNYLEKPSRKNLWYATIFFALMQLTKFSGIIMYPFFGILAAIATFNRDDKYPSLKARAKIYCKGLIFIFVISFLIVWIFYIPHTWNMPLDVQDRLIADSLKWGFGKKIANLLTILNDLPLMKSIVQYLLGAAMVLNRVQGGNTTYFLGQVTNQSFAWYFPVSYLIKTPVPELFLAFLTLFSGIYRYLRKTPLALWTKFKLYAKSNFMELTFLLFIVFYGYISIKGNLNLGIRHLFPIIPLIFMLLAKETVDWLRETPNPLLREGYSWTLALILLWYLAANLMIFPHFVAYFNELAGGPGNAYRYVTDSNIDWGQDLKRLKTFVDNQPLITKIAIDYFGGGEPKYYFCERKYNNEGQLIANSQGYDCSMSKFLEWHAEWGRPPTRYIAVSETFLMNDLWWAPRRRDEGYTWLRAQEPIAKVGYSIYVYEIK